MNPQTPFHIENRPAEIEGPGVLYLRCGSQKTAQRARHSLCDTGFSLHEQEGVLSVQAPADLLPLVRVLSHSLSLGEQTTTRAIFEPLGRSLSIRDCFEVESLQQFIARAQSGWFLDMLRENRFSTHFQPIVSCRRADTVFGYEGLLRGHDGNITVAPLHLMDVARGLDLLPQLDGAARRSALCSAAKHRMRAKIFVNLNPASLQDPRASVAETLAIVEDAGLLREQVVMEVVESECIADVEGLQDACARFRKAGFGIALDDLGSAYSSLKLLGQIRPDYVKLDRELMHGVDNDPFKATIAAKLLEAAQSLKIRTIAEGIETRGEWDWLKQNGGDFGQGFYFAHPAASPPIIARTGGQLWVAPLRLAA